MKLRFMACLSICFHGVTLAAENKESEIDSYHFAQKNKSKKLSDQIKDLGDKKPELVNFASYNDFLNAMYMYEKRHEATLKPQIIINLPNQQKSTPEYSEVETDRDISSWGEKITATPTPADN